MSPAPLEVLAVDNHVLAVVKPAGMPTVPDDSGDESLLDVAREWVRVEFDKPGKVFLGVVQRLDRPVSGVIVFGRTSKGAARLSERFGGRDVEKVYWGIGEGDGPDDERGTLRQWLVKDRVRNVVTAVREGTDGAREAVTDWERVPCAAGVGFVFRPRTGRPHQLRVAAATLGAPLLGDLKYGADAPLPDRSVALHARRLVVRHPTRDAHVDVTAAVPDTPWWGGFEGLPMPR